jgi:hypothetical protein
VRVGVSAKQIVARHADGASLEAEVWPSTTLLLLTKQLCGLAHYSTGQTQGMDASARLCACVYVYVHVYVCGEMCRVCDNVCDLQGSLV